MGERDSGEDLIFLRRAPRPRYAVMMSAFSVSICEDGAWSLRTRRCRVWRVEKRDSSSSIAWSMARHSSRMERPLVPLPPMRGGEEGSVYPFIAGGGLFAPWPG